MTMQCGACGGRYERETSDGYLYFHKCPPVTLVRVKRDGAEVEVPLAELGRGDTVTVLRDGRAIEILASEMAPDDRREGDRQAPREGARDENVDPKTLGPPRAIKAEGSGAIVVSR